MVQRFIFTCILSLFTGVVAGSASPDNFDVLHYEIRLDILDFSGKSINGKTTVTLTPLGNGLNSIELNLRKLNVDSVFIGEQALTNFTHSGDNLLIMLDQSYTNSDTIDLSVYYSGIPYNESWGGFHYSGQYAFNLGVGFDSYPPSLGKAWFPCADNFFDRALYDFHIRVSENKKAVCGGLLQSVTNHDDGTHTFHWKMEKTIPTYLASVAVGEYVEVSDIYNGIEDDVPISIFVRPNDEWKVAGSFLNLKNILAIYENHFGSYPFERVGYTGTALGAMEHAGNIFYPHGSIDNSLNNEWLYAHELSHMWFGNKVTCAGPGEMWLNEGWAVWNELLFREDLYNRETALIEQRIKHRDILQYLHTPSGDGAYHALSNIPPAYVYGKTVYQKGGLVIQTLRNYMGDDLFFPAVRHYLDLYAYSNANTYDLRDALSQHSGIDLTAFFDNWVFTPGFPHYSIDSMVVTGNEAEVFVRQKGKGRDFIGDANFVEITFMNHLRETFSDTMFFDGETGSKLFQLPFEPVIAMMDYNEKICDATSDQAKLITTTGNVAFNDLFCKLVVKSVSDTAFVRVTHNWVTPDPLKEPLPGVILSPYRYWHIDGIIPEGFDAEIQFTYMVTGFVDNTLITRPGDSLFILYRPSPAVDWQSVEFTRVGTWQAGIIKLPSFQKGEYTLALKDYTTMVYEPEIQENNKLFCFPNPGNELITISWTYDNCNLIEVMDILGKSVEKIVLNDSERILNLNTHYYDPGVYIVKLFSNNNQPVSSCKLLIMRD